MSTTVAEPDVTAEELPDRDAEVPCEMLWLGKPCPFPATSRIRAACLCSTKPVFICSRCLRVLRQGWATCTDHNHVVRDLGVL